VWIIQVIVASAFLVMILHDVPTFGGTAGDVETPDSRRLAVTKEDARGS
jgi:hypothetical protein